MAARSIQQSITCEFSTVIIAVEKYYHLNKDFPFLSSMNSVVSGGQVSVNVILYRARVLKSVDMSL